ncbi:hypothetical protein ACI78T_15580 [Blastococcus sp. SYSU D00922]
MVESTTSRPTTEPAVDASPTSSPRERRAPRRLLGRRPLHVLALLVVVLLDLVVPVVHARLAMHVVPVYHLDGAFQTASGLLRLSAGEWPGRDFFPYLGTGPVLALFPAFALAGGTLAASVFSAHLMTMVSLQLAVGITAALFFRRRPVRALLVGAAVPAVGLAAALTWPQLWGEFSGLLANAGLPGNSLRPLRAAAPYVLATVAFFVLRPRFSPGRAGVVGAAAGAMAVLWSNDYGLVSAAALLVLLTYHALRWRPGPLARTLGALWGSAAAGYLGAGLVATAGHLLPLLRYNLVDVREDQFWYFGLWTRADRIYSVGDLVAVIRQEEAVYALAVLVVAVVYALRSRDLGALLVPFVGGSIFAGGLAATVGGHTGRYFWAFVAWGWIVTGVALARLVVVLLGRIGAVRAASRGVPGIALRAVGAAVVVVALVVAGISTVRANWRAGSTVAADPAYVVDPELGGFLPRGFEEQVEAARDLDGTVIEEYMGLTGAVHGPNPAVPVDSVIAALGSQRSVFAEQMAKRPDLVVTTVPEVDPWVRWSVSANWWFYRELFRSYAPEVSSPLTLDWTPTEPATWESVPCAVRGQQVELAAPAPGLYEVTLDYRGPGRNSRSYTMIENNINVVETARGWLALDPGAQRQQFPVAVHDAGSGTTVLGLRDISKDGGRLTELRSCTASAITAPDGADTMTVYSGLGFTPVDLTDASWERGVHRTDAAFFVYNTDKDRAALEDAGAVRFSDGEVREITGVEVNEFYLNVHVEGPPLDPGTAGAPHSFTLVD